MRRPRCDILEREYANHRLSLGGYAAGRLFQSIVERAETPEGLANGGAGQERIRAGRIVSRAYAEEHIAFARRHIGEDDTRLVLGVLCGTDNPAGGLSVWRGKRRTERFREALEDLCRAYSSPAGRGLRSRR